MDPSPDELAGVVDLFGALTRAELCQACVELAFKRGETAEPETFESHIDAAVDSYHLVAVAADDTDADEALLVAGPTAFAALPEGAGDLPHIMDVPARDLPEEVVAQAVQDRFQEDAIRALQAEDDDRIAELVDISYDIEAWGPVALEGVRERLDAA